MTARHRVLVAALLLAAPPALLAAQAPVLVKDFTLGCDACGGALQFSSFQELSVGADSRFLVADRDPPMLRLFDAAGKVLWAGGRRGNGPGEYQYVLRAALAPDGSIAIADLGGRRLTMLGPDHAVLRTTPFDFFATTAGTDGQGRLVVGAESPAGALRVHRMGNGAPIAVELPRVTAPDGSATFRNSSVALSAEGVIAVIPNNERYQIIRVDAKGAALPEIVRNVERVRRTPAEEATLRERMGRGMATVRAAAEQATGKAPASAASIHASDLSLKPHFAVDGLRYDGSGRLWVRTMRGDEKHTLFDVFSPAGQFLGSVRLDGEVQLFAFGGRWMLTSGEDPNGVPVVTRWTVR